MKQSILKKAVPLNKEEQKSILASGPRLPYQYCCEKDATGHCTLWITVTTYVSHPEYLCP